jgi:hypothetical protein
MQTTGKNDVLLWSVGKNTNEDECSSAKTQITEDSAHNFVVVPSKDADGSDLFLK